MKGTWPRMRCCVLLEREPGAEIKKVLIDRGWSMTRLARAVKMTRPHVSGVVHGRYRGSLSQELIAKALGLHVDRAFPKEGA